MSIESFEYTSTLELNEAFSQKLAALLTEAINENGHANIAVSGGSTPKPLFKALSNIALDWEKVNITLADERWVSNDDEASNEKLVKENLLVNQAQKANFVSMLSDHPNAHDAEQSISNRLSAQVLPLDVLILGMGEDGHTASLFPCSEQLVEGFNLSRSLPVLATQPTTAPHQRMSLSLGEILKSKHIFLHITGDKKRDILREALAQHTALEKPIKAVCDHTTVNLVWAP